MEFSITEQTGNKTASEISVAVDDQPFPRAGDIIELSDDAGNILFWGMCGIPASPKYQTGLEKKVYEIECANANAILSNRVVNVAYQQKTISQIVHSLFESYIAQENITLGRISDIDVTMEVYTAGNFNLQSALNELADLVGAVWRVDNQRRFYFLVKEEFTRFPYPIDENFLLGTDLQQKTKDYLTRTVQYITGATDYTSQQSETFTFDGEQDSFTTSFPLAKKPVIYVNDAAVPDERVGVAGVDDPDVYFTYTVGSQTIARENDEFLSAGDKVRVEYTGVFPIRVVSYNHSKIEQLAALTGTSGLRENVYIASNVTTTQDAVNLANSLLSQFEQSMGEVTLWLLSSQLKQLGMTLGDIELLTQFRFDLARLGIEGDYLIVERTIEPASLKGGDYKITLKLTDRNYLKSYGETISALYRDLSQLFIRQDEVVIQQSGIHEPLTVTEEALVGAASAPYPTPAVISGAVFSCVRFDNVYYPMEAGSNELEGLKAYPTDTDQPRPDGQFTPAELASEVYPV